METDKIKKSLVNCSVLSYYIFMLIVNQTNTYLFFILFYFSLAMCGFSGLYAENFKISLQKVIVLAVICITGLLNYFYAHNNTINNLLFSVLFLFASLGFTSNYLDEKTPLFALWLNILIIIFRFLTEGFRGQIYTTSGSNFVSVYLMYPTIVYYLIASRKKRRLNVTPAIIVWILSLLSRGRGGIISSTVFLFAMFIIRYRKTHSYQKLLITLTAIMIVSLIVLYLDKILKALNESVVMEYFIARGGLKSSRLGIWSEYIRTALSNTRNFILGADVSRLEIGLELDNNPHNSFLELHVLNGIGGLLMCLILIVSCIKKGLKTRNSVYLSCLLFAVIRGFTDHVLWAAFGTPVFFYLLFYFDNIRIPRKTEKTYSAILLGE